MGYYPTNRTHPPFNIETAIMNSEIEPERNTIFALSSGLGKSSVAVIRVSGPDTAASVKRIAGNLPIPRSAELRTFQNPASGEIIDKGLLLWFPNPHSFTGEDIAEFHIHGGRAVIAGLIRILSDEPSCRPAEPGEFTRRAFENGKLDLTETEGLADLIDADTEAQRSQALRQMGGGMSGIYEGWRHDLIRAQSLIEAEIDFSDEEDVLPEAISAATTLVEALGSDIEKHLNANASGEIIRNGFRVVLAGPPNVGKSSLLNTLAKRDAAITSPEAGTTRDAIEVFLDLGGWPVHITDTAGIREIDDDAGASIEREGISRSLKHAKDADLVIWVMDITDPKPVDPQLMPHIRGKQALLTLANKSDVAPTAQPDIEITQVLAISAKTGDGISRLIQVITERAAELMTANEAPIITRARHRQHLKTCHDAMTAFLAHPDRELELRAEDLRHAAQSIGRITGRIDVEDILDDLFASFCIGK